MYLHRLLLLLVISTLSLAGEIAPKEPASPPGEKIIRLPEVAITETMKLRPEEKWLTGTVGNFEIFSSASEKKTREFVTELHKFHQAFASLFPYAKIAVKRNITLLLCDNNDKFTALMPEMEQRNDRAMVSHFATDGHRTIFLINLDLSSVTVATTGAHFSQSFGDTIETFDKSAADIIDRNVPIRREYLHLIFKQLPQRVPPWVEEGIVQFFLSMKIADKRITWGQIDKEFLSGFNSRAMLSMQDLFSIRYDSPEYLQPVGSVFSSQSLALVHFCMFAYKGKYKKALFETIEHSTRGPVDEATFKRTFGLSFADMETELREYVDRRTYKHVVAPKIAAFPPAPDFELRETTDAESGRIKGETLRLVKRYDDARIELLSPIMRKHSDARLLGALGQLDFETGNLKAARKFLEESTAAKVDLPTPYLTLAKLRLQDAFATNPEARLNPLQLRQILTPLFAALEQNQPPVEIYLLIADAWDRSQTAPTFDNLVVLDQGVIAFPRKTELIYKNAALKTRYGFTEDARSVAELGVKTARNAEDRARFSKLIASLPAAVSK